MFVKPNNYIRLPLHIRQAKDLTGEEKVLYGEIEALSQNGQVCYASNAYFAYLYSCSERTINRRIEKLVVKGYISRILEKNNQRFLQINIPSEESSEIAGLYPQFSYIPSEVRFSKNLNAGEKMIYGEIFTLSNNSFGKCWVDNAYFENLFQLSKATVKRYLQSLIQENHIYKEILVDECSQCKKKAFVVNTPLSFTIQKEEKKETIQDSPEERLKSIRGKAQICHPQGSNLSGERLKFVTPKAQICQGKGSNLSPLRLKSVTHNNIYNNLNNNIYNNISSSSTLSEEQSVGENRHEVLQTFQADLGVLSPANSHELELLEKEYGTEVMLYAINRMKNYTIRPQFAFKYLKTMVANWKKRKLTHLAEIETEDNLHTISPKQKSVYTEVRPKWFDTYSKKNIQTSSVSQETIDKFRERILALNA